MRNYIFFGLMLLCISCTTESERFLEDRLSADNFDFENLKTKNKSVQSNLNDSGVEYGIITLDNTQKVKFWFVSHHHMSDKGGTIYEFPNGEKSFISGMHCCEVQFNDSKALYSLSTFKSYIDLKNGRTP